MFFFFRNAFWKYRRFTFFQTLPLNLPSSRIDKLRVLRPSFSPLILMSQDIPKLAVCPNVKSFTIVRAMFIVTRSQIMEHSQTFMERQQHTLFSFFTNLSLSSILLGSRIAKISQAVSKILKEVKIMNLLTFLFSYLNPMTNTNAVSILASLHTFCSAINTAHTRLLLSLYFCLFRHLPTLKKISLEK